MAAKRINLSEVPAFIRKIASYEDAISYYTESNLFQRNLDGMSDSDLAYYLKKDNEIMNRQGKRTDKTNENTVRTREELSKKYKISETKINTLLHIAELPEKLQKGVDRKKITLEAVDQLVSFSKEELARVVPLFDIKTDKISIQTIEQLRNELKNPKPNEKNITEILKEQPGKKKIHFYSPDKIISIPPDLIKKYFSEETPYDEIEKVIRKALQDYRSDQVELNF